MADEIKKSTKGFTTTLERTGNEKIKKPKIIEEEIVEEKKPKKKVVKEGQKSKKKSNAKR